MDSQFGTYLRAACYRLALVLSVLLSTESAFAQLVKLDVPESKKHTGWRGNVRVDGSQLAFEFDSGRQLQAFRSSVPDNSLYREYYWQNNVGRHRVFWPVDNDGEVQVHFADETVPEVYWIVSGAPQATNNNTGDCLDTFQFGSVSDSDGHKARLSFVKNEGLIVGKPVGVYRNDNFVGWLKVRFNDGTACIATNLSRNAVQKGDQVRQLIRWRQANGVSIDGVYDGARPAHRDDYEAAVLIRTTEGVLELPYFSQTESFQSLLTKNDSSFREAMAFNDWEMGLAADAPNTAVGLDLPQLEVTLGDARGTTRFKLLRLSPEALRGLLKQREGYRNQLMLDHDSLQLKEDQALMSFNHNKQAIEARIFLYAAQRPDLEEIGDNLGRQPSYDLYIESSNRQVRELAHALEQLDNTQAAEWEQQEANWAQRRKWAVTPVQKIQEEKSIAYEYELLRTSHQSERKIITDRLAEASNGRELVMREKAELQVKTDQQLLTAAIIDAKIAELNQDLENLIAGWNARPKPKRLAELKQILTDYLE